MDHVCGRRGKVKHLYTNSDYCVVYILNNHIPDIRTTLTPSSRHN